MKPVQKKVGSKEGQTVLKNTNQGPSFNSKGETMEKKIGVVGVDAGIIWIGDPCYIHKANENPEEWGVTWLDFCHILEKKEKENSYQFNYDLGHAGLGVGIRGFGGDGTYPVYAEFNEDGEIESVTIKF